MSMLTLYPYRLRQCWVFDDCRTGLKEEAFVLGSSEMITRLVEARSIPNADRGFALHFSQEPFAGYDAELTWLRSDDSQVVPDKAGSASQIHGNWYRGTVAGQEMEGWLCPALGLYFAAAPSRIFVKAGPLPAGVDPIWHVDAHAPVAARFVSASPQ
jgi:hypothetical protein